MHASLNRIETTIIVKYWRKHNGAQQYQVIAVALIVSRRVRLHGFSGWASTNTFQLTVIISTTPGMANRVIITLVFGFVHSDIFLLMVNLNMAMVSQPLCPERCLQWPLGGKRCVTENEGYIIKAGISQPVCTWHCLRNESCDVINYKTNCICLLSSGPCIVAENEDQSIATVFSVNRPCLEWVAFSESERDNSVRVESPIYLSGIRFLADNDKLPGAFSSSFNTIKYISFIMVSTNHAHRHRIVRPLLSTPAAL